MYAILALAWYQIIYLTILLLTKILIMKSKLIARYEWLKVLYCHNNQFKIRMIRILQGKQPILFSMQFIDWCECETQQCVTWSWDIADINDARWGW